MKKKLFFAFAILGSQCCLAQSNGELDISDFGNSSKKSVLFVDLRLEALCHPLLGNLQSVICSMAEASAFLAV